MSCIKGSRTSDNARRRLLQIKATPNDQDRDREHPGYKSAVLFITRPSLIKNYIFRVALDRIKQFLILYISKPQHRSEPPYPHSTDVARMKIIQLTFMATALLASLAAGAPDNRASDIEYTAEYVNDTFFYGEKVRSRLTTGFIPTAL